jgi:hypothetical protein
MDYLYVFFFVCILISSNRINGMEVATLGICERPRVAGSLAVESLGHSVTLGNRDLRVEVPYTP